MTEHINRDELTTAIAQGVVTVIDALPADYYSQAHLPSAINLVEADVPSHAATLLPDLHAPIVTYCSNPACGNSAAVAARLRALGYSNVRTYKDGIQDWTDAGLPVESGVAATVTS